MRIKIISTVNIEQSVIDWNECETYIEQVILTM